MYRRWMMSRIRAVLFDLGDTLIDEHVDAVTPLDQVDLLARTDAAEVLESLSRRFSLALVTDTETSHEDVVRRALSHLGLERFFDAVVTSQDLGTSKPDPRMFLEALRRVGAVPEQAVMVGNDLDRDIKGAAELGLATILLTGSRYYDPSRNTTSLVAHSLSEIPGLIAELDENSDSAEGSPGAHA
jgi:HAD superfamily hydrolase (TIGR01509 family)